jgi:hypothetical protein
VVGIGVALVLLIIEQIFMELSLCRVFVFFDSVWNGVETGGSAR